MATSESESRTDASAGSSPPISFWILSVVALLWNLMGLMAFAGQIALTMSEDAMSQLPEAQQALYENLPSWVTIAFACAVIGGTLGCVLLLLRWKLATVCFVVSLLGVLAQNFHTFFMSNAMEVLGNAIWVLPSLVILVAIALVPFSLACTRKGWLK